MNRILEAISFVGLILVLGPAIAYLAGSIDKSQMSSIMLVGTIVWFVTAPLWMGRPAPADEVLTEK
jgi:hypothetical protein